jgi:hypothetical protein
MLDAITTRPVRPLPLELEELDAEWLTAALSTKAPGAKVEGFEIVDIRRGFTTLVRLKLQLNEAARAAGIPPTVMLKGGFEPHSRKRARTYVMEAVGYRDVWPVLGLRTPTCYFVDAEPERAQAIMIMEDLTARGVVFGHAQTPQTYEQVALRLTRLAEMHAKTWDSPDVKAGGRWQNVVGNGAGMLLKYMQDVGYLDVEGWRTFVDMPRGAAVSTEFLDKEWVRRGMAHLAKISEDLPHCVIHGDTHQCNLYEEPDGEPGFFDSIPRREPAYFELGYTITCALDSADQRRYDVALVRHYVRELNRCGVAASFEDTLKYFKMYLLQGLMFFFVNDAYFQTESFNTVHTSRFSAAMLEHGTKDLLNAAMG